MNCPIGCGATPVQWSTVCPVAHRKGGIPYIVALNCEYSPTDAELESPAYWCSLLAIIPAPVVSISPVLLGEKPDSTFTEEQQSSCSPPEITGQTNKITFSTTELDNTVTGLRTTWFKDYNYWLDLNANYRRYKFGYIDCEGYFYGFLTDVSFKAWTVKPQLATSREMWKGEMSWFGAETKPFYVANLVGLLQGGCP